ncbi:hypothetical protein RRG08_015544 [Elysia crispata]|uniref:Uncharacterized protein n=1 Tax=Elysia crispata TaxID=231223 RepID=A0AAE1CZM7_9GAST|nr:hypothetical protein RRG08_015544 [Elysia crispata]
MKLSTAARHFRSLLARNQLETGSVMHQREANCFTDSCGHGGAGVALFSQNAIRDATNKMMNNIVYLVRERKNISLHMKNLFRPSMRLYKSAERPRDISVRGGGRSGATSTKINVWIYPT